MNERGLDAACADCGHSLSFAQRDERPARCDPCFDTYLRALDNEFLASYGSLGVTSRRVVAETCLRGLVLEMPPARKVLAMAIMEQFLLASSDLIGLTCAVRNRKSESIARSFLSFQLDVAASESFFQGLALTSDADLLASFGLPPEADVAVSYPALPAAEARELRSALAAIIRDLRSTGERATSALLLAELAGNIRSGPALTETSAWLNGASANGLTPGQVATIVLDERRRQLVVQGVSVDEHRLGEVVDAIDCMTRASSNLIYAYLTVQDEEERLESLRSG
jgi:hypothetical protein